MSAYRLSPEDYWKMRTLVLELADAKMKAKLLVQQAAEKYDAHALALQKTYGVALNNAKYRFNDAACTLEPAE